MPNTEEAKLLIEEAKSRIVNRSVAAARLKDIRLPKAKIVSDAKIEGVDPYSLMHYLIGLMEHSRPQSYGSVAEACYLDMLTLAKVKASEGLGDCFCPNLGHIEVKTSLTDKGKFSIQQVRKGRALSYYLLSLYDVRSDYLFFGFVPKDVMNSMTGSQSHGTAESAKENADPEFCIANLTISAKGVMSDNLRIIDRYNSVANPDCQVA